MENNQFLIGEFSKATGVSKRMLRHFDKLKLLSPSYTDQLNGYRYYDLEQVDTISKIKHLQDFGFTLKNIKDILSSPIDFEEFLNILKTQQAILRNDTDQMVHHLLKLEKFISFVEKNPSLEGDIQLKEFHLERSLPMTQFEIIKEEIKALPSASIFYEKISECCHEAMIKHVHFITFDTDNFMYVNENHGYDVGDKVIYTIYLKVRDSFESLLLKNAYNLFTRLGGDELALFIVNGDDQEIIKSVEETLELVRSFNYESIGCMRKMTTSCGIAKINKIEHPMEFRHQSTKALIEAKRSGRDQYCLIEV